MDNNQDVELDIDHDALFELMLSAHRKNITLNQFVSEILREHIEKIKPTKSPRRKYDYR